MIQSITPEEFIHAFVGKPDHETRASIWNGYIGYNSLLRDSTSESDWVQWIGGGYTTEKVNPSDIDLVNLLSPESAIIVLNDQSKPLRTRQPGEPGPCSKEAFKVDAYVVPLLEENHPYYLVHTKHWLDYWQKWFGLTRENHSRPVYEMRAV